MLTGIAGFISLFIVPETILVSRFVVTVSILIVSILLFFAFSTIYQGWNLLREQIGVGQVIGMLNSNEYGGEYVFIIKGINYDGRGKIAELRRRVNGLEITFAVVEFVERNSDRCFQARPVWISPIHQNDLRKGRFSISEIIVEPVISNDTLSKVSSQAN